MTSLKDYQKNYREANKERAKEYQKEYYKNNKKKLRSQNKRYYCNNKKEAAEYNKAYREKNKDSIKLKKADYYQKNKEKRYDKAREKMNSDPLYKLKEKSRNCIKSAIKRKGYTKNSKTYAILGKSYKEFMGYLINRFEIMYDVRWNDAFIEKLDMDHIVPISTANSEEEVIKLNRYDNLQLLYYKDNRYIKRDKISWKFEKDLSEFYLEFKEVLNE